MHFQDALSTVEKQKYYRKSALGAQGWSAPLDIVCSIHAVGGISLPLLAGPSGCGSCDHGRLETLAGNMTQRLSLEMEGGTPMEAERLGERVGVRDALTVIAVKKPNKRYCVLKS